MKSTLAAFVAICVFTLVASSNPAYKKRTAASSTTKKKGLHQDKRRPGSPLAHLPSNIQVLT